MKKLLSIFLVVTLLAVSLVGCGDNAAEEPQTPPSTNEPQIPPAPAEDEADGKIAKIGLGHVTSIAKSRSLDGDTTPQAQVDNTNAAVAFDKDGKIVKVSIDTVQTRVAYDKDLNLTTDVNGEFKTKKELGDAYGMKAATTIGKEWYEQIEALEEWMVGKTVEEVKAMKTYEKDPSHLFVPDEPELASSVTITVEAYIAAVEEAYANAIDVAEGAETLGLGHSTTVAKSRGLSGDTTPQAQVDTTIAVTAFDANGNVVNTILDAAQTRVAYDKDGKVTTDLNAEVKTKKELGDAYGMKNASGIGKEWYEQIAALEDWMAGKSVSEITGMKTYEKDPSHLFVPDVPELASSVTITVESYLSALEDSYANAK